MLYFVRVIKGVGGRSTFFSACSCPFILNLFLLYGRSDKGLAARGAAAADLSKTVFMHRTVVGRMASEAGEFTNREDISGRVAKFRGLSCTRSLQRLEVARCVPILEP